MPSLTPSLERALERALSLAADRKHEYATLEHLLLALTEDEDAAEVMTACKLDIEKLRRDLANYLDNDCASFVVEDGGQVHPTAAFQRVVQRAVLHVESSSKDEVTGANVLVAIFAERESHAAYFLQEQQMTRYDAVNYISHGIAKRPGASERRTPRGSDDDSPSERGGNGGGGGEEDAPSIGDSLGDLDAALERVENRETLRPALAALPERDRTVLLLRFFEGQTQTQIVVLSKHPKSWMILPLGQNDHPDSPHFDDQAGKR